MDKELDDLLDSALDDFEIKPEPIKKNENTSIKTETVGNFTIEKTNLYVDDIDYEDRPPRKASSMFMNANSSANVTNLLNSGTASLNNPSISKAKSTASSAENDEFQFTDENMKMFEEIFNDEKTKDSMKKFKDMFNMFKNEDDESKVMQNFEKVMSELTTEDLNDEDGDDIDLEKFDFLKSLSSMMEMEKNVTSKQETKKSNLTNEKVENLETEKNNSAVKKDPLAKALEDLNKNSENVLKKNPGFPFGDFLSSLNLEKNAANGEDDDNLDTASSFMMEPILNMLFSKEILYPSLKLMFDNYDTYINDRREKMSEDELKKCLDQKECIKEMCSIYETQKETDSSEVKSENLKKILDLLEKCGMPPSELVPEVNPFEALGDTVKGTGCPIS